MGYSQPNRDDLYEALDDQGYLTRDTEADCSSAVSICFDVAWHVVTGRAWDRTGSNGMFPVGGGVTWTGSLPGLAATRGFMDIGDSWTGNHPDGGFMAGDLLMADGHVAMIVADEPGGGECNTADPLVAEMWIDAAGTIYGSDGGDGAEGDQNGSESRLIRYSQHPHTVNATWTTCLRHVEELPSSQAQAQAGTNSSSDTQSGSLTWGVDVSSHNGEHVPSYAGEADFVIVKVTEGDGYVNPKWRAQAQSAWDAGMKVGLYHFARNTGNSAEAEARAFLGQIRDWLGYAELFLDWEDDGGTWDTGWARDWLDQVWYATPTRPLIYMSASVALQYDWSKVSPHYQLWCAGYTGDPWNAEMPYDAQLTAKGWDYCIWQYSESGGLDKNTGYFSRENWDRCVSSRERLVYRSAGAASRNSAAAAVHESGAWIPDNLLPTPPSGVRADGYGAIPVNGVWDLWTVRRQARVFWAWGKNEREGVKGLQAFLNSAMAKGHIQNLIGKESLGVDGDWGSETTKVFQFWAWCRYQDDTVWRTWCNGWRMEEFVDGQWGHATCAVYQGVLNGSWGNSGKLLSA